MLPFFIGKVKELSFAYNAFAERIRRIGQELSLRFLVKWTVFPSSISGNYLPKSFESVLLNSARARGGE